MLYDSKWDEMRQLGDRGIFQQAIGPEEKSFLHGASGQRTAVVSLSQLR